MHDDPMLEELRALPREAPRAGFAERVLARLDETPRRAFPFDSRWPVWAAASVAICAFAIGSIRQADSRQDRRRQVAVLKSEGERLAAELAALRASVGAGADRGGGEVIYLGGDEGTDYVIDLSRLARSRNELNPQPASYRSDR